MLLCHPCLTCSWMQQVYTYFRCSVKRSFWEMQVNMNWNRCNWIKVGIQKKCISQLTITKYFIPEDYIWLGLVMIFEFLLIIVQQVESFSLTLNTRSTQILLEAKDSNCLVLAADQELRVYSLKGALLASFNDHTMPISSICVVGRFLIWNSNTYHLLKFFALYGTIYPLWKQPNIRAWKGQISVVLVFTG